MYLTDTLLGADHRHSFPTSIRRGERWFVHICPKARFRPVLFRRVFVRIPDGTAAGICSYRPDGRSRRFPCSRFPHSIPSQGCWCFQSMISLELLLFTLPIHLHSLLLGNSVKLLHLSSSISSSWLPRSCDCIHDIDFPHRTHWQLPTHRERIVKYTYMDFMLS